MRPVLIIDEAQEMLDSVFNELRLLSSKEFDSRSPLCVVFAGDSLPERFRKEQLLPLGWNSLSESLVHRSAGCGTQDAVTVAAIGDVRD